ncbi:hypothetical protein WMY93_015460 [Mugilogobius chulae]|uniref:Uncharacterized protein n=1 Tax=Mugilogobius chulae TaxID=88201 RepID=A0AAW0P2B0_9GOBI
MDRSKDPGQICAEEESHEDTAVYMIRFSNSDSNDSSDEETKIQINLDSDGKGLFSSATETDGPHLISSTDVRNHNSLKSFQNNVPTPLDNHDELVDSGRSFRWWDELSESDDDEDEEEEDSGVNNSK